MQRVPRVPRGRNKGAEARRARRDAVEWGGARSVSAPRRRRQRLNARPATSAQGPMAEHVCACVRVACACGLCVRAGCVCVSGSCMHAEPKLWAGLFGQGGGRRSSAGAGAGASAGGERGRGRVRGRHLLLLCRLHARRRGGGHPRHRRHGADRAHRRQRGHRTHPGRARGERGVGQTSRSGRS